MRKLIFFVLSCICLNAIGQSLELYKKLKVTYPDDVGLYLDRNKSITLLIKNDSLYSSGVVSESVLFLKDQANQSSEWRVYGSYFQGVDDIQAKSLLLENGRYKELKMKTPTKRNSTDNSVFYDDSYFYSLSFPASTAGNQASWSYTENYKDPKFLPAFYFSSYLPQVKSTFTIKATKEIDIAWSVYNDPDKNIHFNKYDKGSFTFYEWTAENVKAPHGEENSPKFYYYVPQIVYYVKSYPTKKGIHKVLTGLDDLYESYLKTISALNEKASQDLESIVHGLMDPKDKEIDIVRKVFYWVQDHIRYVAFEDGMRGLVPHTPNYIVEKRYGDCKDMASLIVGMLQVAGIKSYHTWIGTRDLPYRYTTLPTPLVDNHMIATYIDDKKNYFFLDATGNYTTVDLPSSMIQGKEALIVFGKSGYEIHQVPEISGGLNSKQDTVRIHLENKSVIGKGTMYLTGYQKIDASYALDKADEDSKKDNVISLIKTGNNKFYMDAYKISSLHEKDIPLKIEYSFKISDYVNEVNNELYFNLNLTKVFYNNYIPMDRKTPRENDFKAEYSETYILDIPEGYEVEYLPSNAAFDGKSLSFKMNYFIKDKTIVLQSKLYNNVLMLPPDQFADWNESIRSLSKAYKDSIILKKTSK